MATLMVEIDDEVLSKATKVLARRDLNVDQVVQDTLRKVAEDEFPKKRNRESFRDFLESFRKYDTGGPYTRDEMNER
jgi:antitoxin component of RelBE/YafQ-DinJ toxin-antitoxin module